MAIKVHPGVARGERLLGLYVQDYYIVSERGGEPLSGWDHRWYIVG
jgi:hypothetical protein